MARLFYALFAVGVSDALARPHRTVFHISRLAKPGASYIVHASPVAATFYLIIHVARPVTWLSSNLIANGHT